MRTLANKLVLAAFLVCPTVINASNNDSINYFESSFQELKEMLEGTIEPDFERAVYLSEAPYWNKNYSYENFTQIIDLQVSRIQLLMQANNQVEHLDFDAKVNKNGRFDIDDLHYTPEQKRVLYLDVLKNWSIFKYITDTTAFYSQIHEPFKYSTSDPFGLNEWKNSQVIQLLTSNDRSGNCYSLTALYKILANRLGAEANICTAPQHIYIQHKDKKGQWYNVELATAGFPSDGDLLTLTNSPAEAIRSGIVLRTYNEKQLIGLNIINLAKSFERKYQDESNDFLLKCADLVLKHDEKNLNALLLKQQVLDHKVYQYALANDIKNIEQIKNNKKIAATYYQLQEHIKLLYSLNYRPMPVEMQDVVMNGFKNEEAYRLYMRDKNPSPFTTMKPIEKEDETYISLSGGLFKEVHERNDFERFGHFRFDTKKQEILGFLMDDFEQNIIDPVAFAYNFGARIYDARIGRFISTDPLAHEFPWQSPYTAMDNNPINMIDPTGMAAEPVYDLEGNHLGNTEEGFTGEALIYSGDEDVDFSTMSADDAKKMDGVDTYDNQRSTLSNDAKSSIWNNIVSKMEGAQIYDETFSMSTIEGGIQYRNFGGSWGVPTSQAGKGKGNIYGSDKYGYETTVENIQSSVIVHEWYSHMQKGNRDAMKSHRLAYKNVINYKDLWNKTTDRYKGFNMIQLRNYTESETGRTKVDPLYRNLYNKYYKKY